MLKVISYTGDHVKVFDCTTESSHAWIFKLHDIVKFHRSRDAKKVNLDICVEYANLC